ncbi:hypothetical protein D3C72_2358310 [compost metagenome]
MNPIVHSDMTRILGSAYSSASASRLRAGTPVSLAVYSRSYLETNLAKSSKVIGFAPPAFAAFFAAFCKGCSGRRP